MALGFKAWKEDWLDSCVGRSKRSAMEPLLRLSPSMCYSRVERDV